MNVMNKTKIKSIIRAEKKYLTSFGIKKIGVFGSFARNEQTSKSDIDFLVEFQKGMKSYANYFALIEYLSKLFNNKIDIVTKESLSPYIKKYILKEIEYV